VTQVYTQYLSPLDWLSTSRPQRVPPTNRPPPRWERVVTSPT